MKKRILSIILSIVMLVSLLPTTALAAEGGAQAKWGASAGSLTKEGTLQAAFDAAASDSSITYIQLQSTVALGESETLTVTDGSFTLDLNGQTISGAAYNLVVITGGTITIDDTGSGESGKISGTSRSAVKIEGGTLNLKGGRVEIISANRAATALYISGSSTVEISGGEVYAESTNTDAPYPEAVYIGSEDSSLTVSGGSIAAKGPNVQSSHAFGISANKANSLNIAGGSISATVDGNAFNSWATGIYVLSSGAIGTFTFSNGSIYVSGGERTGGIALYEDQALTISGGSITLNNAGNYAGAVYCYQVGATITVVDNAAFSAPGNVADFNSLNNSAKCVKIILQYTNGVSAPEVPYKVKTNSALGIDFTNGWLSLGIPDGDIGKYFTAPATNQKVIKNTATNELQLVEAYTISFSTGGYATNPESQKLLHGEKVTKPVDPVREAHKLNHWCTQYGCSNGAECGDAWDFDTDTVIASDTLYAVWERTHWIVTYNSNGATSGTVPTDINSPYIFGSTVTVLGNTGNLAKTGYAFVGWNTNSSGYGTDRAPGDTFGITANTTLYAQWEEYEITTQPTESTPAVGTNADGDIASYQWYKGTMSEVTDTADGVSAYTEDTLTSSYSDGWWTCHGTGETTPGYFTIALTAGDSILAQTSSTINEGQLGIWAAYEKQDWDWTTPDDHFLVTAPADGNYDLHVSDVTYGGGTQPTVKAQVFHIGSTPADGATSKTLVANEDGWYACKITYKDGTVLYSGPVEYEAPSIPVSGVTLSESSLTLDVGDTAELTATISPDNATDKTVSWTSSDPTVAKVENGLVTALKPGSTTITATANDGSGKSAICELTVNKIAITGTIAITTTQEPTVGQEFSLDYIVIPNGNYSRTGRAFSPSGSIEAGKDYTLSVGLKPNDGYYFADGVAATVNGENATIYRNGDNISINYTYSFVAPKADSVDILLSGISADTAPVVLPGVEQNDVVLPFTAKVLDQYGQEMTGQTIEWSITGTNTTGISVNNDTVTVSKDAAVGNYTLTATCDGKSDSITIQVKKAESVLTTVKIFDGGGSGNEITTIDRTIPDVGYTLYINSVAKGYDQYGEVMTGLTFTWSNTNTDSEISLINGYVTIKSGAKEGSFSYTASCNGKSATVTVNLTKKMFTVTYTDNVANETVFSDVQLSVQSGGNAPAYPDGTPSRTGYTFDGWYTSTDGGATLSASAYDFDTPVTGNLTLYAKWTEKATVSINDAVQTYTWNGSGKSFEITDTPNTGFTVQYKVNGNWTTTAPSAVGTYDVKITRAEDNTYKAYEKEITGGLVINAAAPNYTAPTAKTGLVYTGQPQTLVNVTSTTGGTMYYAIGGKNNPTGTWSTSIPTKTDAGTYYVWYKIEGDPGYTDVGQACVSVTIAKAPAATTPDSSSYTVNYAAETITFTNPYEVSTKNDGSGTTIASGDISGYLGQTIYIRAKGDSNHESSEWVSISIAARPAAPVGVAVTNETIAGQSNGSVTGITAEMEYKIGTGAWTPGPADLTGLAADTQITVRVKATAAAPHGEEQTYTVGEGSTLTVTFDAQNGSTVAPVTGLSYNATLSQLPETTRTGYTFGGWFTEINGGGSQLSVSTQITGNITYYAKWTPVALTGAVNISGTLQVGQTLTATVSGDNNTGALSYQWYRGEEAISEATGSTYTLVAADAGKTIKCVVSSSIQTGTVTSAATAAIAKLNAPAAPTGLAAAAPSAPAANDGKITGVTADMEYSTDGTNWTACTDTEITGLGSGTYYVRIAETGDTDAGASVTIVVPAVYTVTFEANGGSEVTPVYVVHGNKVAKPTDPAKSRFIFAGWYTAAEGGVQYDFNAAVTGGLTLFAQWSSEPVYDITGEVDQAQKDGDPIPAVGVTVTLRQGNTILFTKTTDTDGKYDFHAPAGTYNIVAVSGEKTMTQLITVTDHNEQASIIVLPYQNVSSKLTIPVGTPNVVVGGLDEEVVENSNLVGTATSTTHVALTMTVEQKEDVTSSEAPENAKLKAEQEEIKTEAGSQSENLTFFTIDLSKITTTNQVPGEPEEVTNTANLLEIIIPFETSGRLSFKVYRYHGSDVDVLTTTANGDGEHIEVGTGMITIHARKFSTYAIGYTVQTSGGSYTPTYAITVEKAEHGTIKANRTYASYGSTVTITTEPEDGYVLSGLTVTDSQGNKIEVTDKGDGTYTFKMPRRKVTVTAVFAPDGGYSTCPKDNTCPIWPYTDAETTAWYHDGVHYCIENGLMAGYGNGIFKPNADTTRAMITVMLWRLNGSPVVNYLLDFEDVEEGQWYTEAIRWAKSEGIATGYGNGYFGTNDAITREQMVTILWRYAQHMGIDVSVGENTNILSYNDAFDVAEYAIPAMQWACGSGMAQGMNDPNGEGMILAPESKGTRAQIATMMMRFCTEIVK